MSEKAKQHNLLLNFLTTGRGIAFNQMFVMTEYPHDVLPLYAQGFSLARFLIAQRGKPAFVNYVAEGMRSRNWSQATYQHYGYKDLSELQVTWLDWVRRGSPPISPPETKAPETLLAQTTVQPAVAGSSNELVPVRPVSAVVAEPPTRDVQGAVATIDAKPTGGWYSRVRDKATQDRGQVAASPPPEAAQTLSHAQSIERPQPRVLEWSHSPPSASLAPAPTGTILR
jgi:hypothetical protein